MNCKQKGTFVATYFAKLKNYGMNLQIMNVFFFGLWLWENYNWIGKMPWKGEVVTIFVWLGHYYFLNNSFQYSWWGPIAKCESGEL